MLAVFALSWRWPVLRKIALRRSLEWFHSSSNGDNTVTLLEPGSYQALVEHPGVVDVRENAPLLRSSDGALGQVIDNEKVTSLPLNGRSSFRLVELTPGYVGSAAAARVTRMKS